MAKATLNWKQVNPETELAGKPAKLYAAMLKAREAQRQSEAYKAMVKATTDFEESMVAVGRTMIDPETKKPWLGDSETLAFAYNFGKLSIAKKDAPAAKAKLGVKFGA